MSLSTCLRMEMDGVFDKKRHHCPIGEGLLVWDDWVKRVARITNPQGLVSLIY